MSDHVSSRAARLDRALTDLLSQAPELEAAAVVSFDGLAMASTLPDGMDEDRVAAMSAALLSLGEKAAQGLGRGDLSQVYVEGETGTVFLISCDDEAVLVAVAAAGAKAGLMLFEVRRSAKQIADVLRLEAPAAPVAVDEAALAEAEAAYAAHKAAQAAAAQPEAPAEPVAAPAPVAEPYLSLAPEPDPEPTSPVLMPVEAQPVVEEARPVVTPLPVAYAAEATYFPGTTYLPEVVGFPEPTLAEQPTEPVPTLAPLAAPAPALALAPWETPPQQGSALS
jgi:predicted regulator of Ras-like GTPase activity (Roadblock/LC7/MglB family)